MLETIRDLLRSGSVFSVLLATDTMSEQPSIVLAADEVGLLTRIEDPALANNYIGTPWTSIKIIILTIIEDRRGWLQPPPPRSPPPTML